MKKNRVRNRNTKNRKSNKGKSFPYANRVALSQQFIKQRKFSEAEKILLHIIDLDNTHLQAHCAIALLYNQTHRSYQAIRTLSYIAHHYPENYEIYLNLGIIQRQQSCYQEAINNLLTASKIYPTTSRPHIVLSYLYIDINNVETAKFHIEKALHLNPACYESHAQFGRVSKILGNFNKAQYHYRLSIQHNPHNAEAYYGIVQLKKFFKEDNDVESIKREFNEEACIKSSKILFAFSLGKIYDDLKCYNTAFRYLEYANSTKRNSFTYSSKKMTSVFTNHITAFNDEFVNQFKTQFVDDNTPIFIVGMPRSGTSLVEQIVSAHSQVYGAGEIHYSKVFQEEITKITRKPFPERLDRLKTIDVIRIAKLYINLLRQHSSSEIHITDKLPHNFFRLGLILPSMPKAKIIHCTRNPIDNCFSIYQHNFSSSHGYASSLSELGEYYKDYSRLMNHWHTLCPNQIFDVNYEDLVLNPKKTISSLLSFCHLEFEESCMNYDKIKRAVNTPSAVQVRQPLYKSSIGRWKNYRSFLLPLEQALNGNIL